MTLERKYFGGWEVDFDNPEQLATFIQTHGLDKQGYNFFKKAQSALEFQINDGKIIKALIIDSDGKEMVAQHVPLPITEWEEHKVFYLSKNKNGTHRIGGKKPKQLILPTHEVLRTPFQYIGTIDGTDPLFKWLDVPKLDLVYPLYECNMGIMLDYSDPDRPQILNPETFSNDWFDGEIVEGIEFQLTTYQSVDAIVTLEAKDYLSDDIILCGVPLWYQEPEVPKCPVTGEVMRYLCTLNSDSSIEVVNQENYESLPFGDYLVFGDHGHLYVFYHPESKILSLVAQW